MTYKVTISFNLKRDDYSFNDPNAHLIINGDLHCKDTITLYAEHIIINGTIKCEKIKIFAKSILINGYIFSQMQLYLNSQDFLDINEIITSNQLISLIGKRIILRKDIYANKTNEIIAHKLLILGNITSFLNVLITIEDYFIKIGNFPIDNLESNNSHLKKELKDPAKIKRALKDDFQIESSQVNQILQIYSSKFKNR